MHEIRENMKLQKEARDEKEKERSKSPNKFFEIYKVNNALREKNRSKNDDCKDLNDIFMFIGEMANIKLRKSTLEKKASDMDMIKGKY